MKIIEHKTHNFISNNDGTTNIKIGEHILMDSNLLPNHHDKNYLEKIYTKYFWPATATFIEHKRDNKIYQILKMALALDLETDRFIYCQNKNEYYLFNKKTNEEFYYIEHMGEANASSIKNFTTGGWENFIKALHFDLIELEKNWNRSKDIK